MFEFSDRRWLAKFAPEYGGNLYELKYLPADFDVLHTPEDVLQLKENPILYGIPVLFPPNRIHFGKFRWRGTGYTLPLNEAFRGNHLHGMALRESWQKWDRGTDWAAMEFDYPGTPGFPHAYSLHLRYTFGDAVEQMLTVTNRSAAAMPFGLGYHTAFTMLPGSFAEVTVDPEFRWEMEAPDYVATGGKLPWNREHPDFFRTEDKVSCHCPAVAVERDGRQFQGAVLEHPSKHLRVVYEADGNCRNWCLWNPEPNCGFLCIEPMSWVSNAPNLPLPESESGLLGLEPGQSWTMRTEIRVETRNE